MNIRAAYLGLCAVAVAMPLHSKTVQLDPLTADILLEDALAVKCMLGYSINPHSSFCDQFEGIRKRMREWTQQALEAKQYVEFMGTHEISLTAQLAQCAGYGLAGDEGMSIRCRTTVLNAHDYLTLLAFGRGTVWAPEIHWTMCSQIMSSNLEMGARCMVAVRDIAPCQTQANNRDLVDYLQCFTLINNGDWMANPKARRLSFDAPRADARKDFKVVVP